eukprot:TRINITY_DN2962_c0_g1_i1.p1 TRINITY_DN2962_c0_g1~~TRINITY_DN2962_c0_g1_i1.p1  ORF type:complete len:519 (-),score=103.56 TRINITY_DN2962_c0_g1_i1:32-1588(-)
MVKRKRLSYAGRVKKLWEETVTSYIRDEEVLERASPDARHDTDFIFVPFTFERYLFFAMCLCLDHFLFYIVVLPYRFIIAVVELIRFLLSPEPYSRSRISSIVMIDIFRVCLVAIGVIVSQILPIQAVVELLSASSLKLKMMMVFVEMMDRLLVVYGMRILSSAVWTLNTPKAQRGGRLMSWPLGLACFYVLVHSSMLRIHLSILQFIVESGKSKFLVLLVLLQFAELKSAVLKKITPEKLMEMCSNDAVERFQQLLYLLFLTAFHLDAQENVWNMHIGELIEVVMPLLVMYISEVLVDWLKHTSVIMYNGLSPHIYTEFTAKMVEELASTPQGIARDRTHGLSLQLGHFPLPFSILAILTLAKLNCFPPLFSFKAVAVFFGMHLVLLLMKFATGRFLKEYYSTHYPRPFTDRSRTLDKLFLKKRSNGAIKRMKKRLRASENKQKRKQEQEKENALSTKVINSWKSRPFASLRQTVDLTRSVDEDDEDDDDDDTYMTTLSSAQEPNLRDGHVPTSSID